MSDNEKVLKVKVQSDGITATANKLDSLTGAADRTEKQVKKLTDTLGNLNKSQGAVQAMATAQASMMKAMAQAMGDVSASATATSKAVQALTGNMQHLTSATTQSNAALAEKSRHGGVVTTTLRAMAAAASAYLSLNFAKGIVESADGWAMMQAKLKLATGSMQEAKQVQEDLFQMAQKLRVPMEDAAKLYTRMALPMQRMGKDSKETAEQVEFVSLALKLGGATAAEASSVMLQYSQAVNAGRLNGAEFNAVAEGAPSILRAIEAELKATGEWSNLSGKSLKKMGADGEITFDLIRRAAVRALPEMRKDFEQLPLTVDGAIQRVKNAWFKAMGELGENTGLSKKLAEAVSTLEKSIPAIRDSLASIFMFLSNNFNMITSVIQIMIGLKLVSWAADGAKAMAGMAAGAATLAVGLSTVAGGAGKAAGAVGFLTRAAGFLAGPWGTMISLVGTGAVLAYQAFSREAPKAEAVVTEATRTGTVDRINLIQKEINKLNELNGVKKAAAGPAADPNAVPEDIMRQRIALSSLIAKANGQSNETVKAGMQITINARQAELQRNEALWTSQKAIRAVTEAKENDNKVTALTSTTLTEYATKTEKANAAVEKVRKQYEELGKSLPAEIEKRIRDSFKTAGGDAKAQANYYTTLRENITATSKELALQVKMNDKLTESEKLRIKLVGDDRFNKLPKGDQASVLKVVDNNIDLEKAAEALAESTKATIEAGVEHVKFIEKLGEGNAKLQEEIAQMRERTVALTDSKAAAKDMTATRLEEQAAIAEGLALRAAEKNLDYETYDLYKQKATNLRDLAAATREYGEAQSEVSAIAEAKKAASDLEKYLDPSKAEQFGAELKKAFGGAGESIGKMTDAMVKFGKEQKDAEKQRAAVAKTMPKDSKQYADAMRDISHKQAKTTIGTYGDMAGAAKGFFKENSKGYKAMETAERTFRAFELALTLESMYRKMFAAEAVAAANVAGNAMSASSAVAGAAVEVPAKMAVAQANAIGGVANQANGDPYSAFPRMALMAAIMAGLGLAVMGGGGSSAPADTSKKRQKLQGTGTVLGMEDEKSKSISNALDLLADNSDLALAHSSAMLSALYSIRDGIAGMAMFVARGTGLRGTAADQAKYASTIRGNGGPHPILGKLFASKTTTSLEDQGIMFGGQSVAAMRQQATGQSYSDIASTKKTWYGSSKTSRRTENGALDEELLSQISMTMDSMVEGITTAAMALGKNGAQVEAQLDSMGISLGKISLKGLSGEDIAAELEAVFGQLGDNMAKYAMSGLNGFQKVGEGYFETLIKVASGVGKAKWALDMLGVSAIHYSEVANKQGEVGTEIVRQSLMLIEGGSNVKQFLSELNGSVDEIVDSYKKLTDIRSTLRKLGLGISDISRDMIRGAGGLDNLQGYMEDFLEGMYTESERHAIATRKLREEFTAIGQVMPATKDEFRFLVGNLSNLGAVGQEAAGKVLALAGAFAELQQIAEDNVETARDRLSDAYNKEAEELENLKSKFQDFTKSLLDFQDSLRTGELSPKTNAQKYAEASSKYADVASKARSGDQAAIAEFQSVASAFLQLSKGFNASGDGYIADFNRVATETALLADYTSLQTDVATASLEALNRQVAGLITINESVLTVTEAIRQLDAAMFIAYRTGVDGSHQTGLSYVPFDGYTAKLHEGEGILNASENRQYQMNLGDYGRKSDESLVNEIRNLREEVKQLKEEQRDQTGRLIASNYDANARASEAVVDGTKDALSETSWKEKNRLEMI